MNSASSALVDMPVTAAPRCATCEHPLAAHDAIGVRWCAATKLGVGSRACICSGVVVAARVLTHY
jgi:hypothetical protein